MLIPRLTEKPTKILYLSFTKTSNKHCAFVERNVRETEHGNTGTRYV